MNYLSVSLNKFKKGFRAFLKKHDIEILPNPQSQKRKISGLDKQMKKAFLEGKNL